MTRYKRNLSQVEIVNIGDLCHKIKLYTRSIIDLTATSGVDYSESFTNEVSTWANIQTVAPIEVFDGVNIAGIATHAFYIRYRAGVTSSTWIGYKSKYYNILGVENCQNKDRFLKLLCSERGITTTNANLR